jgi:hypothetical protein
VFRNVSPDGWIDLIAINQDAILYLDVKTSNGLHFGAVTPQQAMAGVAALYVLPDGTCVLEENPKSGPSYGYSRRRNVPVLPRAGNGITASSSLLAA